MVEMWKTIINDGSLVKKPLKNHWLQWYLDKNHWHSIVPKKLPSLWSSSECAQSVSRGCRVCLKYIVWIALSDLWVIYESAHSVLRVCTSAQCTQRVCPGCARIVPRVCLDYLEPYWTISHHLEPNLTNWDYLIWDHLSPSQTISDHFLPMTIQDHLCPQGTISDISDHLGPSLKI